MALYGQTVARFARTKAWKEAGACPVRLFRPEGEKFVSAPASFSPLPPGIGAGLIQVIPSGKTSPAGLLQQTGGANQTGGKSR